MAKRLFDLVGAVVLLLVMAVPAVVIYVAVRTTIGAPVLFRQRRPGRHGVVFTVYKFRTMRSGEGTDAERLTRLGRFLRLTSLDELPQLFNVVRGQMSLIGPRPLLEKYLDRYTPPQARRHDVRPGMTGLAQVSGRNSTTWDERLAFDVRYVDERSLGLDLWILWRTMVVVLRRTGISAEGHATMPELGTTTPD